MVVRVLNDATPGFGPTKNSTRVVLTLQEHRWTVEMWQRPAFGCAYVQTRDSSLRDAYTAARAAIAVRPQ